MEQMEQILIRIVGEYYKVAEKDKDISRMSFILDYLNYLLTAQANLDRKKNKEEIAYSIVKTYYSSGKYNEISFDEFFEDYLKTYKDGLDLLTNLDKNKTRH